MSMRGTSTARPPGRNDPCSCGSGRKFKHCCAGKPPEPPPVLRLAEAELRRGERLEREGRLEEAILAYRVAAMERPEANSRLGNVLASLGRTAEAIFCLRAAAASDPENPARRMDLVRALLQEGDAVQAQRELRRVVADDPTDGRALWLLGRLLTEAGDFVQGAELYERALAVSPTLTGVYYDLTRVRTLAEADRPLISRMLGAVRSTSLAENRAMLHLALAKAFDDLGEFAAAMEQVSKANQIRRAQAPFNRAMVAHRVDALIDRFTPDFMAARLAHGHSSAKPAMVVGLPRSGTTLVEQILSSHPAVVGAGELNFWPARDRLLNLQASEPWRDRYQAETAESCLAMLNGLAPEAERVIDKNPFNFLNLGLIHACFPRATLIHCRRHAIDTCLSMAFTHLAPRSDLPVDLADLVFYYRQYERLMAHWRRVLPPDRFIEVDYETLVNDPEPEARRLVKALQLDWDPACLAPERNSRAVKTNSAWQARQPIYRGSVERWRRYEPWLGPLRELAPVR